MTNIRWLAGVLSFLVLCFATLGCDEKAELVDVAPPGSTRIASSRLAVGSSDLPRPHAVLYGSNLPFSEVRGWYDQEFSKRGLNDASGGQARFEDGPPRTVCVSITDAALTDSAFLRSLSTEERELAYSFETVYSLVENRGCAR